MVKLKQLFHVGIFIIAGVSCFFQSVAQTNNSKDFGKTALQESIIPIHPGIPGKTPFWNIYAKRFIYAPAFNYKSIPGAKKYRYEIKSLKHSDIFSFENNIPNAPLSPVWKKIPVGYFIIKVTGISANGDSLGLAGQGRYWEADKATGKKIYLAKAKSIANTLTWVQSKHNGDYPSFFTNNDMPLWLNGVVYPAKIMMELKKNIENLK